MRHLLLPVAVITGLLLSIGGAHAQSTDTGTGTVTATCRTAHPSPVRNAPAPAGAMAACSHGVRHQGRAASSIR